MKKIIVIICTFLLLSIANGCKSESIETNDNNIQNSTAEDNTPNDTVEENKEKIISYHFADKEEGVELLMSNDAYFDGFSKNELEFKMQKKDATIEEYKEFAKSQVLDFSDDHKALIDEYMSKIEQIIITNGYHLPQHDEIVFVCTTMEEECGVSAYTHGIQIYLGNKALDRFSSAETVDYTLDLLLAHELFHCLTRCNPDFRKDMYKIIHFTIQDEDFVLPSAVKEYYITNPDVEHIDAYAQFVIDGKPFDCYMALVTKNHFEKKGDLFFDTATAALVPVDGSEKYYYPEDAANFDDILGKNTDYTIDPEECMADNFAYAIVYGLNGQDGKGYNSPEIIEGIIDYLKQ